MERWNGKVAIVTGTSAGIGAAVAELLVKQGLKVVGLARRVERTEELAKKLSSEKGKLYAVKADISKENDIKSAFEWTLKNVGPVSILINNAGIAEMTSLTDGDTEKWKAVFDTNVIGLCIATREAVKIMKDNNIDGHIVHINSLSGHRIPILPVTLNVYPASKYAVTALTETLRQELNQIKSKIKVTSVSPGAVKSEFGNRALSEDNKLKLDAMAALESEDVAEAVLYVLSTPPHVQVHELMMRAVGTPN